MVLLPRIRAGITNREYIESWDGRKNGRRLTLVTLPLRGRRLLEVVAALISWDWSEV